MRRSLQSHTNTSFQVFADTSTAKEQSKHHTQYLENFRCESKALSQDDAVQRTTDKGKPFILSPRSRVNSQKENFDIVKMQLVSCGRTKSTKQPGESRARALKQRSLGKRDYSNKMDMSSQHLEASHTQHWPVPCLSDSSRHNPSLVSPEVDELALVLSDVVIDNSSIHSNDRNLGGLTTRENSMLFSSKISRRKCPKPANGARQNRLSCSNLPAQLPRVDTKIRSSYASINRREQAPDANAKVDKRNETTRPRKRETPRNHQEQRSKTSQQYLNIMSTPPTLKRTIR